MCVPSRRRAWKRGRSWGEESGQCPLPREPVLEPNRSEPARLTRTYNVAGVVDQVDAAAPRDTEAVILPAARHCEPYHALHHALEQRRRRGIGGRDWMREPRVAFALTQQRHLRCEEQAWAREPAHRGAGL